MEKVLEWISSTFNVTSELATVIFYGAIGLVSLVIILIIVICSVKASKKKKISTKEVKQENVSEIKVEETSQAVKVEEVSEKAEAVDEEVKSAEVEEAPVEEVQKEVKEEVEKKVENPVKKTTKKATPKVTKKEEVVEEVKEAEVKEAPARKNLGKFTISQEGVNFRYRLKASNGELLVVSELYTSENSARTGIETIKKNAETAKIEIVEDKHGLFSFRVMTKQGRCLATSANYKTKKSALSASESFKKFVVTEKIELEDVSDHFEVEEFNEEIQPEEKGKFKISSSEEGFVYQLVASNGRVIATSQTYKSLVSCKEGLEKFRVLAYEGTFFIFKDKNNKYQFKLYNKQKRLILAGEVYDTKDRVVSVIESIKRFAKLAEVIEQSQESEVVE